MKKMASLITVFALSLNYTGTSQLVAATPDDEMLRFLLDKEDKDKKIRYLLGEKDEKQSIADFGLYLSSKGKCLSGDCQDGKGKINFPGVGIFEGKFSRGVAHGMGLLKVKSGNTYLLELQIGSAINKRIVISGKKELEKNHIVPEINNSSVKPLTCLVGDCFNGYGYMIFASFIGYPVIYKGKFKDGQPEGIIEIFHGGPTEERIIRKETGNFVNGKKEGTFKIYSETYKDMKQVFKYEDYKEGKQVGETRYASDKPKTSPNLTPNKENNPQKKEESYSYFTCSACYGMGYKTIFKEITRKEYDSYTLIMPGDKNYGSWSGKTHYGHMNYGSEPETKTYHIPIGEETCRKCQGTGTVKVKNY